MKKTLKRLPILLAFIVTVVVSACSEIDVTPRGGEEDEPPIVVAPPKPKASSAAPMDSLTIG